MQAQSIINSTSSPLPFLEGGEVGLKIPSFNHCLVLLACSSIPRKIPWTEEPSGMQSLESQRVRHDRAHTHTDKGSSQGSGNSHI